MDINIIELEGYLPSYHPSVEWRFNEVRGEFSFEGFSYQFDVRGPRMVEPYAEEKSREKITQLLHKIFPANFTLLDNTKEELLQVITSGTFQYSDTIFSVEFRGKNKESIAKIIELFKETVPQFVLDQPDNDPKIHKFAIEEQLVVPAGKQIRENHPPGEINAFLPLHMGGTNRAVCQRFVDLYVTTSDSSVYLRLDGKPIISEVDVLRKAVAAAPSNGVYLDFGFATARTSNEIARQAYPPHAVYAFDVGTGSPMQWTRPDKKFPAGLFAFKQDEKGRLLLPPCDENVFLSLGLFHEELPKFATALKKDNQKIAFMCIDSETFESAKCIFDILAPFVMNGVVIYFDEIQNFEEWEKVHEHLALLGFLQTLNKSVSSNQRWTLELVAFNPHHQQAAFRVVLKNISQQ
ncbi:MAG: hypothetical protein HZB76_00090 [Chlamydiae bacterium]|nr:hypothetical protein [Chlamydiota bacterium]